MNPSDQQPPGPAGSDPDPGTDPIDPRGVEPTIDLSGGSAVRTSATVLAPDQIGPYRLGDKLGEGGMGSVYRATDGQGREVALKLLRAVLVNEPGFAERFQREAQIAGSVVHENVVRLLDHGVVDGHHYMAFELLTGGDLGDLIKRRGVLTQAKAFAVLRDAAQGLAAIRSAGMVHRDIKPGNIFLDQRDHVRIGDLGLARHTDGDDRMTMTGVAMGTPAYMSPEHVQGVADIDIRTDIYALGATLYKMLTGQDPYIGDTLYLVTSKILNDPVPDPRQIDPNITSEAAAIIRKAMAKQRDERYQTPEDLIQDLERARSGQALLHAQVDVHASRAVAGLQTSRMIGGAARQIAGTSRRGPRVSPKLVRTMVLGVALVGFLYALSRIPDLLVVPQQPAPSRPDWAADAGSDQHGHWADLPYPGGLMRMRFVPTGSFVMGSPSNEEYRKPTENRHEVSLSRSLWMAEQEVTQGMWRALSDHNPSHFSDDPRLPVENVSWYEAEDFCARLADSWPGMVVRLPSEAEWEYACRAGTSGPFGPMRINPDEVGNFAPGPLRHEWWDASDEDLEPEAVIGRIDQVYQNHVDDVRFQTGIGKSRSPNAWGLYDMHGNVSEWCRDRWSGDLPHPAEAVTDPLGDSGELRIVRGGSWYDPPWHGRAAARSGHPPEHADFDLGFRFVIEHVGGWTSPPQP